MITSPQHTQPKVDMVAPRCQGPRRLLARCSVVLNTQLPPWDLNWLLLFLLLHPHCGQPEAEMRRRAPLPFKGRPACRTHHFQSHVTGQNLGTPAPLVAREAGKCDLLLGGQGQPHLGRGRPLTLPFSSWRASLALFHLGFPRALHSAGWGVEPTLSKNVFEELMNEYSVLSNEYRVSQ